MSATKGLIVTSAAVISPFLRKTEDNSVTTELLPGTIVDVLIDDARSTSSSTDPWVRAQLLAIEEPRGVRTAIARLTQESIFWQSGWVVGDGGALPHADLTSLAPFSFKNINVCGLALLQVLPNDLKSFGLPAFLDIHSSPPTVGDSLLLVGSPYGLLSPDVFVNSIASGVVSNLIFSASESLLPSSSASQENLDRETAGKPPLLLITDGRCLPGMEGGALFDARTQKALAIIMVPLRHREAPVDLSFGLSISAVVHAFSSWWPELLQYVPKMVTNDVGNLRLEPRDLTESIYARVSRSLVMVAIGSTWASGVLVGNSGHVLTNAHVIKPFMTVTNNATAAAGNAYPTSISVRVRLDYPSTKWINSVKVLWVSSSHWDLALLQLPTDSIPQPLISFDLDVELNRSQPIQGTPIIVIGHAVFGPSCELMPMCTCGLLSKTVVYKNRLILLESSAAVHQGNSGGMVVDRSTGALLGIVTSNAKHSTGQVIPQLNFAVPINILAPIAQYVRSPVDTAVLETLSELDSEVSEILSLKAVAPPPSDSVKKSRFMSVLNQREQQQNIRQSKL